MQDVLGEIHIQPTQLNHKRLQFCLIVALNFFEQNIKFKIGHFLVVFVQNQVLAYQDILLVKTWTMEPNSKI